MLVCLEYLHVPSLDSIIGDLGSRLVLTMLISEAVFSAIKSVCITLSRDCEIDQSLNKVYRKVGGELTGG